jgi:hypothetical protein
MRPMPAKIVTLSCAVSLLVACAGGIPRHDSQLQTRERYAAYAGEPIDRFTWLGRYYSWESLGNNQLVLHTTPNDAYLLTVSPPCNDLNFVQAIGLTSTGNTVSARLDSVRVKGWNCPIAQIRQVDSARMRADMRAETERAKQQPPPSP